MKHPLLDDCKPLMRSMETLGHDLLSWRDNKDATHVHSWKGLKVEADRRANERLTEALRKHWPGVPIISEEDATHKQERPDTYWLLDPIDGTASWLNGFSGFVTQMALIRGATPIVGLIYAPALGRFYAAAHGEGAFCNSQPMDKPGERASLIFTDNTPEPHGLTADLGRLLPVTGYVESGSLGLKSCLVADGTADLFVKDVVVRDWDLAPAAVLFGELGCFLLSLEGEPFPFFGDWEKHGFVAARNERLARQCLDAMSKLR